MTTLRTARLVLRPFAEPDVEPLCALNADPRVMEHFPSTMGREQTLEMVGRLRAHFDRHGYGFWSVDDADGTWLGLLGLAHVRFEAAFTPAVEVGWRLRPEAWGRGVATEGAEAALAHGFGAAGQREIVAMTVIGNHRSWRIMDKLGMTRDEADDFDHPLIAEGHPIRRHILYRLPRGRWAARRARLIPAATPARLDAARTLFREYEQAIGIDLCFQGFADELASLPGKYAGPDGCLLLAEAPDGELVGCVALRPLGGGIAELKRLYTRPSARGSGLGRRLVEAVLEHARGAGHTRVRLDTLDTMTGAIALYRALGFTEIPPYGGPGLPGTRYFERTIAPR